MKAALALALVGGACSGPAPAQHLTVPMQLDTPGAVVPPPPAAPLPIAWDRDLGYLPADSELVLGIDLAQLRGSALWRQYAPVVLAKLHDRLAELRSRCGFDPLETITGVSLGAKGLGGSMRGALVVHGVARAPMTACIANAPGGSGDAGILAIHSSDGDLVATFVDDTTLLAVTGAGVTKADLDAAKAGTSALPTSVVFTQMFQVVDKHGSGWMLMTASAPALVTLKAIAGDAKALIASATLTDHVTFDARLRMGSNQTASTLAQMLNGQLAQARSMFDRIDVAPDAEDVHVQVEMTSDQLERIAAMLQTPLVHRDSKGH